MRRGEDGTLVGQSLATEKALIKNIYIYIYIYIYMFIYFTKYIPAPEAETKIRKMIIVFQKYLKFEVCRNRRKITYVQDLHGKKLSNIIK